MPKGYMYILECSNGSYYVGSTVYLEYRYKQHQNDEASKHAKSYLPVVLVNHEVFPQIHQAFNREKQVQGWGRKKKEA